jgi:hypothetical protein
VGSAGFSVATGCGWQPVLAKRVTSTIATINKTFLFFIFFLLFIFHIWKYEWYSKHFPGKKSFDNGRMHIIDSGDPAPKQLRYIVRQ